MDPNQQRAGPRKQTCSLILSVFLPSIAIVSAMAIPLVSTFWGIVLFGEFRKSSGRTYILLWSMLSMFVVAVAVLMASSGQRKYV